MARPRAAALPVPARRLARLLAGAAVVVTALGSALGTAAGAAGAQGTAKLPPRPKLPAGADTNNAGAYQQLGNAMLDRDPATAARAFYWATRIDPGNAEALYGRRVAELLARGEQLPDWWGGRLRGRTAEQFAAIDSLGDRALALNPLVGRHHDGRLIRAVYKASVFGSMRRGGYAQTDIEQARGEIEYAMEKELSRAGPRVRAMLAMSRGDAQAARSYYEDALKEAKKEDRPELHAAIARAWVSSGDVDQAIAAFERAIAESEKQASAKTVRWYEPKARLAHSIGLLHERAGRDAPAREAYGRALVEDLSYAEAHTRLGMLALSERDTATAVRELQQAVELRGDDAMLRLQLAVVLVAAGRAGDAPTHLEKAIALEPWFAAPYFAIARLYEAYEMKDQAVKSYADFVARVPASDPRLPEVRTRLAALGPVTAAATSAPAPR